MADPYVGAARAVLGQGLGMGWGDEAEAFLRSKLGQGTYAQQLGQIRGELGQYHKENPVLAPSLEFAGGMLPGLASMAVPGGQAAGAMQLARAAAPMTSGLLKSGALGALTGAVSGAGAADKDRASGALAGGVIGGTAGVALPLVMRGATTGAKWLSERLKPTEAKATVGAARNLNSQLARANVTPAELAAQMAADKAAGVPSMLLNAAPRLEKSARMVVKRVGAGADELENALFEQRFGSRERVHQQAVKGLHPGDYYADEERLVAELRQKAGTLYDKAYAHGSVDDPRISAILDAPELKNAYNTAREIAAGQMSLAKMRGEDPSKFALKEVYKAHVDPTTKAMTFTLHEVPDVRTLDYMKKALDAQITAGYKSDNAAVLAKTGTMKDIRNELRTALKDLVPDYRTALHTYGGDIEVIEAMRAGMKDFNKMDHEQVIGLVSKMSQAEKEAFRTGVSRDLYSKIMDPSGNSNAAQRVIGSPEAQQKLRPLFNSAAEFDLFKNALTREAQLHHAVGRITGGSDTAESGQLIRAFEGEDGVRPFLAHAANSGFWSSLTNTALRAASKTQMSDLKAGKMADMLMSGPDEVAAVVKLLEHQAAADAPWAARATGLERGIVTGLNAAGPTAPIISDTQQPSISIDDAAVQSRPVYDIEDALK